jgi:hypothetical protein
MQHFARKRGPLRYMARQKIQSNLSIRLSGLFPLALDAFVPEVPRKARKVTDGYSDTMKDQSARFQVVCW